MKQSNTNKTEYILRSLNKIRHKKWELFIISKIVHSIDHDIEFVTQQLVRRPDGSRAQTDLYFPQLRLHLEIDEPFHDTQLENDFKREQDIIAVTEHSIQRIKVLDPNGEEKRLEDISQEVDVLVELTHSLKRQLVEKGSFVPWDFESRYSSKPVIERGFISVADNVTFRTQVEAMRCFGFKGNGWQRGAWRIPDGTSTLVWFPRLYEHGIWQNELSPDGERIYERALKGSEEALKSIAKQKYDEHLEPKVNIVFAKAKDSLGFNLLRYVGTFKMNLDASTEEEIVFNKIRSEEPVRQ